MKVFRRLFALPLKISKRLKKELLILAQVFHIRTWLLAVLFAIVFVWGANFRMIIVARPIIYSDIQTIPPKQVALVPGARILGKNTPSAILEDRLETAMEIYRAGKVSKILLSGDHGTRDYDEVNVMRRYLLKGNIPPEDIFMDHAGFDTYDSVYRAKEIFSVSSMIIVSQDFHLPRALYIAQALKVDAIGADSSRREYSEKTMQRNSLRETGARVKAFFEVMFNAKPKFLGERIPISGDGRVTIDE